MKLLLDQGLPRSTIKHFKTTEIQAVHVGEVGMASAGDAEILEFANQEHAVVVTLDADFHALLARSAAKGPSVIRIRIEGLRAEGLAALLEDVLQVCGEDVRRGAVISVTERSVRIGQLPL